MTFATEAEPESSSTPINRPASIAALICIFIMGPMYFLLMPLYVGALVDHLGLNNQQIGTLTSLELLGSCLASLSGLYWIRKVNWQKVAIAVALALLALNLLSNLASTDFTHLILVRVGAGFSAGSLMAIAITALGDTEKLDRNFALAIAGQLGLSGTLFFLLAPMVAQYGVHAFFSVLSGCALLALIASLYVPSRGKAHSQPQIIRSGSLKPLWGLAGSTTFFVAQTAFWAFVERMGVVAEFSAKFIGTALGFSTLVSVGAALGVGWLTQIISRFWIMLVAALGELACLAALVGEFSATTYFIAVVLFQICWNGWVPIQMANIAEVDSSGHFTVLIGLFQALGVASGPVLVAQFLTGSSFLPVNIIAALFVILTVALFVPIAVKKL